MSCARLIWTEDILFWWHVTGTASSALAASGERVAEEYHHQGVGRELVEELCGFLARDRGEHCMTLTASPYAKDFYKKLGFVETEAGPYPPGLPVTFMEKRF